MAAITSVPTNRNQDLKQKQYHSDLKSLETSYHESYRDIVRKNEDLLKKTKDDYDTKIVNLKSDLETKLIEMRSKQMDRVQSESERLDAELRDLKAAHSDKKQELIKGQDQEINTIKEGHQNTIETSRRNFEKEKNKFKG